MARSRTQRGWVGAVHAGGACALSRRHKVALSGWRHRLLLSRDLEKFIGPDTMLVAVSTHKLARRNLAAGVYTSMFGSSKQPINSHYSMELFDAIKGNPHRKGFKVIVGGSGGWQITQTNSWERLSVDCVVEGRSESADVLKLFDKALAGDDLPKQIDVVHPKDRNEILSYDDDVHPYSDLDLGRLDAVLLDDVLANRRHRVLPGFTVQPDPAAVGHYVSMLSAKERTAAGHLQRRAAHRDARRHPLDESSASGASGTIEKPRLYARLLAGQQIGPLPSWAASVRNRAPPRSRGGSLAALPAVSPAGVGYHDRVVMPVHGTRRRDWRPDRDGPRLRGRRGASRAHGLRVELMPRHADHCSAFFVLYYGIAAAIRLPAFRAASSAPGAELRPPYERTATAPSKPSRSAN